MDIVTSLQLSQEQLVEYGEAFGMFDLDGDGTVTAGELGTVLQAMGQNPTEKEVQEMIAKADLNDDQKIDFKEFCTMMEGKWKSKEEKEDDLRGAFEFFDKDKSGRISVKELQAALTCFGEKLTEDEVKEMIALADEDKDGQVSYKEFVKMMSS